MTVIRYRPQFQSQRNPADPYRKTNCVAYCTAMQVDFTTVGGLKVDGATIRALSNEPIPDPAAPGLNFEQMREVAKKLRVSFVQGQAPESNTLLTLLRERRMVQIAGWYSKLAPEYRRANYLGKHVILVGASSSTGGSLLIADPLDTQWRWVPRAAYNAFWASMGRGYLATRQVPNIDQ